MLGRPVAVDRRALEGPADVRVEVRAAHRDVDQRDAAVAQESDQAQWLLKVRRLRPVGVCPEAPIVGAFSDRTANVLIVRRERRTVVDVHARCEDETAADAVADLAQDVRDETRARCEVAPVGASSRPRGEQLVQQVCVALLDVDEVEADVACQRCCVDEPIL